MPFSLQEEALKAFYFIKSSFFHILKKMKFKMEGASCLIQQKETQEINYCPSGYRWMK